MKKNIRRPVVMVLFGLVALLVTAFDCQADSTEAYRKGQEVTLVLPTTSFEKVETKKKNQPGDTYEVAGSVDDRGRLVLGGDPLWRSKSLPLIVAGEVTSIKTSRKAKETTVTFVGSDSTFVFRVPADSPWQQAMAEVLVNGHSSISELSPDLSDSLSAMLEAYCSDAFIAPLDSLDMRARRRVAELQLAVGSLGPPSTTSLNGEVLLDADLGTGPSVYNTLKTSASKRASRTITDRVLPAVKAWAGVFYGDVPFDGIRFTATITHRDFAEYPPRPSHDELEFIVGLKDAKAYAADKLTGQELVDAATVMVNGGPK